jgi:MFS family permease
MAQERSAGSSWLAFFCVLIAGMSYAISLMAVPTAMVQIAMEFWPMVPLPDGGMMPDITNAGLLMSFQSITGTILAFFTGPIQAKVGPKVMVIAAVLCCLISDIMMVIAADPTVAFVARFILGFANGLVATSAPTLIQILFTDPTKRGMPTGIWSMWIALGGILISFLAPMLMGEALAWQPLFYFAIGFSVVALILVVVGIRIPEEELRAAVAAQGEVHITDAFKNPYTWLLFVCMICFAYSYSCYTGMAVTYFQSPVEQGGVGMDVAAAQANFGLLNFIGIIAGFIAGAILNKVNDHTKVLAIIFVLAVIAIYLSFQFTVEAAALATMAFFGLAVNMVVPVILNNNQWVSSSPAVIAASFGILAIASNGGGIPANPTMGMVLASGAPYSACAIPPTIVGVIGLICAIVFCMKRSKFCKEGIAAARAGK